MTVASVIPLLIAEWKIGAAEAGAIVTSFTVCYAVSLFAFAWGADYVGAKRAVIISAVASAVASAAFGLFARDWTSAFILYGLIGLAQGGVYTPLIMLIAERNDPVRRGTAMGWLIASTSVGYATSLLGAGLALSFGDYRTVFLVTGLAPTIGAVLLCLFLRGVENRIHRRDERFRLSVHVFGSRDANLLTAGYMAHCWELLGSWAWLPSLIAAAYVLQGNAELAASRSSALATASMYLVGAVASFVMGTWSDRIGRRAVLLLVGGSAAIFSFVIGWLVWLPPLVLICLTLAYSALTIGDSPVLTTATTEVAEPGQLGAVLAVRSLLGFGVGAVSPLAAGLVFDATTGMDWPPAAVWGFTFGVLGLGGIIAAASAAALRSRTA